MYGPEAVLNDDAAYEAALAEWAANAKLRKAILLLAELRYSNPCDTEVLRKVDQFLLEHGNVE